MPKLTPQQIQEINRYLEKGNPIPDKYHFLLPEYNCKGNLSSKKAA
jgi:hypothetical protein